MSFARTQAIVGLVVLTGCASAVGCGGRFSRDDVQPSSEAEDAAVVGGEMDVLLRPASAAMSGSWFVADGKPVVVGLTEENELQAWVAEPDERSGRYRWGAQLDVERAARDRYSSYIAPILHPHGDELVLGDTVPNQVLAFVSLGNLDPPRVVWRLPRAPSLLYGAAAWRGELLVVQSWTDRWVYARHPPGTEPAAPQELAELGFCSDPLFMPVVLPSEEGVDIFTGCDDRVTHQRFEAGQVVAESALQSGGEMVELLDGQPSATCGGPVAAADGEQFWIAVPEAEGTRLFVLGRSTGALAERGFVSSDVLPRDIAGMAARADDVLLLGRECGESSATLVAVSRESSEVLAAQEVPSTIDGADAFLAVGTDEPPFLVYEDGGSVPVPAFYDLSHADPSEPVQAAVLGELPGSAHGLALDCVDDAHCRVIASEMDPTRPLPLEDARTDRRPVVFEAVLDDQGPEIAHVEGDASFWSRTPWAEFRVGSEGIFVANGLDGVTVLDGSGEVELVFDYLPDLLLPIAGGFLSWEFRSRESVCRYEDGASEPVACAEASYMADNSGTEAAALLDCGGTVYWAHAERTEGESSAVQTVRLRFAEYDIDALEPGVPIVDDVVEFDSNFVGGMQPDLGCSGELFFARDYRYRVTDGESVTDEIVRPELGAGGQWTKVVDGDTLLYVSHVSSEPSLDILVVRADGPPEHRVAMLPREGYWHGVQLFGDWLVVLYSADSDLRLARVPLLFPEDVPPVEDIEDPPTTYPDPYELNQPPCEGGLYFGRVSVTSQEDLAAISECRTIVGDLLIQGTDVTTLAGLASLERVLGRLFITDNERLTSIAAFPSLERVGGLVISDNPNLSLDGAFPRLASIGLNGLRVSRTDAAVALELPALGEIGAEFTLSSVPNLTRVELPAGPLVLLSDQLDLVIQFTAIPHCSVLEIASQLGQEGNIDEAFSVCDNVVDECGGQACVIWE